MLTIVVVNIFVNELEKGINVMSMKLKNEYLLICFRYIH